MPSQSGAGWPSGRVSTTGAAAVDAVVVLGGEDVVAGTAVSSAIVVELVDAGAAAGVVDSSLPLHELVRAANKMIAVPRRNQAYGMDPQCHDRWRP